ncbi:MAG: DUF1127 domain-containing protein [Alphaproteobacteria bacterium]
MSKTNAVQPFGSLFTTMTAMVSPAHELITQKPLYDAMPPLELRPWRRSLGGRFVAWINRWATRHAQQKRLAMLDDRLLRDVGLTRQDVIDEQNKPFWRV